MNKFYNKYIKLSIFEITISSIFVAFYILFGIFPIKIPGVMQIGLDFVILALMGLILGPIKGVFTALISDTLNLLIIGIAYWMWEYELINICVVLLSSAFIYVISMKDKTWIIFSMFIIFIIFSSIYITIPMVQLLSNYKKINMTIQISVIILSIIILMIYIYLFTKYLKSKEQWIKDIITFFNLSALIIIIFSWIAGPFAFIAYMNRISDSTYDISNYSLFVIPRIMKTFFELPLYTICISTIYNLVINKLNYKIHYKNIY